MNEAIAFSITRYLFEEKRKTISFREVLPEEIKKIVGIETNPAKTKTKTVGDKMWKDSAREF